MADRIDFFFDYSCPFTYRAWHWLRAVEESGRPIEINWKTFSLREQNRGERASYFEQIDRDDVTLLRLAFAKAAQAAGADIFNRFHDAMYEAIHGKRGRRDLSAEDIYRIAQEAGIDTDRFDREYDSWVAAVGRDHREGRERWNAFGVPTINMGDRTAYYLKFTTLFSEPERARRLFEHLYDLGTEYPEVLEIKQPH